MLKNRIILTVTSEMDLVNYQMLFRVRTMQHFGRPYNPDTDVDAGHFVAPYIPMMTSDTLSDEEQTDKHGSKYENWTFYSKVWDSYGSDLIPVYNQSNDDVVCELPMNEIDRYNSGERDGLVIVLKPLFQEYIDDFDKENLIQEIKSI